MGNLNSIILGGEDCLTPGLVDNRGAELTESITADPTVLVGKPVIVGTRISVEFVVGLLASGRSHEQILESYPHLSEQDILACRRACFLLTIIF